MENEPGLYSVPDMGQVSSQQCGVRQQWISWRVRGGSALVGRVRVREPLLQADRPADRPAVRPPARGPSLQYFSNRCRHLIMIWFLWLPVTLAAPGVFPLVDPGLFVISGVGTCGDGAGYCLLGLDCTLDEDFLPDDGAGQHCEGLRSAFTPSAHFVCCRAANRTGYKPPIVLPAVPTSPRTTTPIDVLENEIDQVLLKVVESVDAVQKSPATEVTEGAELRGTDDASADSEESSLLEQEVLEGSIEGGILQGDEDIEEEMQNDEEIKENLYEEEHPIKDEVIFQNNSSTETASAKIEESSSEENSDEENSTSSEMSENESSSEEMDSDEVEPATIKTDQKPLPSPEIPTVSGIRTEIKGDNENDTENSTDEVVSQGNYVSVSPEEPENSITGPEESLTDNPSSKENPAEVDETSLEIFQNDESTKHHTTEVPNPEIIPEIVTDKNKKATEKPNQSKDQKPYQNISHIGVERTTSKPTQMKIKPSLDKIPNNEESSKIPSPDTSLNEVVLTSHDKKNEDNSLHSAIYGPNKREEDGSQTNATNEESHIDTTTGAKGELVTSTSVYPERGSGRPGSQGQAGLACSRGRSWNCTQEIKFLFQNRTLCFGSIYSVDWVVTSASCALRIFRTGMVNVSVAPLAAGRAGAVRTIIVHESYAENAGLSGQHMEANNIGLVQMKMTMREWAECVPCLPQPGHNLTSNCTALTDHPMAHSANCSTPGSCKASRTEAPLSSCRGKARDLKDDLGFHYLTLACDTLWEPRFSEPPQGSGAPLYCEDVLAGLEASAGMGLMVYTPIVRYLDWLRTNTRTITPDQHFNLGSG